MRSILCRACLEPRRKSHVFLSPLTRGYFLNLRVISAMYRLFICFGGDADLRERKCEFSYVSKGKVLSLASKYIYIWLMPPLNGDSETTF